MPFAARTRDAIRDALLAAWEAEYAAKGETLDISNLSHHWRLASGLAVLLSLYDAMGVGLAAEILPDQATYSTERHAKVDGIAREAATFAIRQVTVTGTPSATITLTGKTLQASDGTTYSVSANADGTGTSVALSGGGTGTVYATCQTAGVIGNKPVGSVLTWSSAPTGANPTGTVAVATRDGQDQETLAALAQRVIARRQERPASGNRADWRDWAMAVDGVEDAVVYPLLHPSLGVDTPGAVTVVVFGPAQCDSVTNTRIVSTTVLDYVAGYIEGTNDASGAAVTNGTQLRPVTIAADGYSIERPTATPTDVTATLVLAGGLYASPWAYNAAFVVLGTPAPSGGVSFSITGDQTATLAPGGVPLPLLVDVGDSFYRGGYYAVTPTSVTYNGGTGKTDFVVPAMPGDAKVGSVLLPGIASFSAIRTAIFALFDGLGPGDTSPACRWPGEETSLRATLYNAQIVRALTEVAGVLSATVTAPASDTTPAAKHLLTLRTLKVFSP